MKSKLKTKPTRPLRLEWIEAGSLADNPRNWRRHDDRQIGALKSAIVEVGWAGALLFNERTGRLIDGHARKNATDPKTPVPVLVGSWTEEQEAKILLTLDPIGAMAGLDQEALQGLVDGVAFDSDDLSLLAEDLKRLAEGEMAAGQPAENPQGTSKVAAPATRWAVIIECQNEKKQKALLERLSKEGFSCKALIA